MADGFGFTMSYTIVFENATADYDLSRGAEAFKLFENGKDPQTLRPGGSDGYVGELEYLLDCIRTGRPPSVVTALDGVRAVEICEAEEHSVRTGKAVEVDYQ
jgi:predicted dehydrogenase